MYEFWQDYIKLKYQGNAKLCYMDTDSLIIHLELKIFAKILQIILRNGLTHQSIVKMIKDRFQQA